jgi:hypothetical protein
MKIETLLTLGMMREVTREEEAGGEFRSARETVVWNDTLNCLVIFRSR